ncbi:MAG TPA: hypothetical protein VGH92_12470 [Gaiellaceae bacterium]
MHGAISIVFLGCIALVWLAAVRGRADGLAVAALAALGLECVLVVVAGGNCPLGPVLRRIGDDTPLFELVLPPRAAKAAIPVLGVVAIAGAVTLAFRTL